MSCGSKKKVGIITIHKSPNYGACLQSYALWKYISILGYDCEIIDLLRPTNKGYKWSRKYLPFRKKVRIGERFIQRVNLFFSKKHEKLTPFLQQQFDAFNQQIKYSNSYKGIDDLYANPPQYDIYITGSDQVWNPQHGFSIEPYFLTFVKDKKAKKIAYASSIGLEKVRENEQVCFQKWLSSYDAIGVRENTAVELLSPLVDGRITQVLDPTFLLDISHWQSIAQKPQCEDYIFAFLLLFNAEFIDYLLKISKESRKKLILFSKAIEKPVEGAIVVNEGSISDFLGYFQHASLSFTDSFHGTVFSILMGSQNFYSYIGNPQRGTRIFSLLNLFGLSSHILSFEKSYVDLINNSIDREKLMSVLLEEQEKSRQFLKENL